MAGRSAGSGIFLASGLSSIQMPSEVRTFNPKCLLQGLGAECAVKVFVGTFT